MNLPQIMGTYIAKPSEWTAAENGPNNLLTFICRFDLLNHWNGTEWIDVADQMFEVTGYFYLQMTNGQINTRTVDNLRKSLGWDGRSIQSLSDGAWKEIEVQLVVEQEDYKGKKQVKVKWINPRDSMPGGPGIEKTDPAIVKSFDAKFGPALRALAGNAPPKPNIAAPPALSPQRNLGSEMDEAKLAAKKTFASIFPGKTREELAPLWISMLAAYFAGRAESTIGINEWKQFAADGFEKPVPVAAGGGRPEQPFGDEKAFDDSEIPFRTRQPQRQPL